MADSDLQSKLHQARVSMRGNRDEPRELLATELVKRRQSALTFTGDTPTSSSGTISIDELAKRREQAKRAMESFEQKKRRELKEKSNIEAKVMAQKIEAMKDAREKLEHERASSSYQEKQREAEAGRQAAKDYHQNVAIAQAEIEVITKDKRGAVDTYRTLQTDFGQEVATKGLTMTKIVLEEEARRRLATLPREGSGSKKSWVIGGISILFILLGVAALYGTIQLNNPKTIAVASLSINSIAFADDHVELPTTNTTSEALAQAINKILVTPQASETIINIYPTAKTIVDGRQQTHLLTALETLTAFGITTPISFYHFLEPKVMLGIVGTPHASTSAPFFIFKTRSFENTFDALLRDEKTIIGNLLQPFVTKEVSRAIYSTTFKDKLINNIDTRIITTATSTSPIAVYGFMDRSTVVVTTNESAFLTILRAYQTPRPAMQ